jgi:thiol-disulfide isomerase/thioredoxin
MQKILIGFIFISCSLAVNAQSGFATLNDSATGQIILQGIISEEILRNEASFKWMNVSLSNGQPDSLALTLAGKHKDSLHLLIFLGTWCEDSQQILPKLFALLRQANIPKEKVSLLGVDRQKKTLGYLSESFQISRVPTIIILKNGIEKGRIIEYGKYGNIEKDLRDILLAF